jgi:tetratricopeptide (TPR) repeat protein
VRPRSGLRACRYYLHASQRAQRRHRPIEAVAHAREGLRLLERAPDTIERLRLELALEVAIGAPAAASSSWAARELEEAYQRAEHLLERIEDSSEIFPMLWGIWAFNVLRSRMKTARKHAARLLALARRDPGGDIVIEARLAAGLTRAWLGDFPAAQRHLEAAVAEYDERRHRAHASRYGQDPLVLGLTHLAWVHWFRGRSEAALDAAMDAIAHARRLDEPPYARVRARLRRDPQDAQGRGPAESRTRPRDGGAGPPPRIRAVERLRTLHPRMGDGAPWRGSRAGPCRDDGRDRRLPDDRSGMGRGVLPRLAGRPLLDHPASRDAAGRALDAAMLSLEAKDERFFASEVLRLRARHAVLTGDQRRAERLLRRALALAEAQGAGWFRERVEQDIARLSGRLPEPQEERREVSLVGAPDGGKDQAAGVTGGAGGAIV